MNKGILRAVLALAIGFACLGGRSASALTIWNSPWGSAPTYAIVGCDDTGFQYIVWIRLSDGAGEHSMIGDTSGLWDDVEVHMSTGNDIIRIMEGDYHYGTMTFHELRYNGHYADIFGGPGNDIMQTGNGDTWVYGEAGNDNIISLSPAGMLSGSSGNDNLKAWSTVHTGEALYGDGGDDCLEDTNLAASTFDCGPGNDWTTFRGTPANAKNCERQRPDCDI